MQTLQVITLGVACALAAAGAIDLAASGVPALNAPVLEQWDQGGTLTLLLANEDRQLI